MSVIDELVVNAERYAASFDKGDMPTPPARKLAVVTCMDARIKVYDLLGLREGDAHIIRNAGGVITDDQVRSLAISQHLLGTEAVMLIHHTECGLLSVTDDQFRERMRAAAGVEPVWSARAFTDVDASVRDSIATIVASPFIPHSDQVRGFVYDVRSGRLREVPADR